MAADDNILGTTVSIQTDQAAMDLLSARQQEARVQAETVGSPPGGDHPAPPVFPAFTSPDRTAFEDQFVRQQVTAQNYSFFDKTPAQLDRIVSEAYRAEVATAQAAFESASPPAFNPPLEPPPVQAQTPIGFRRGFGPSPSPGFIQADAIGGQAGGPFANPSAYGGPDEPGGLGGPMQWDGGPTDLVRASGMTRYSARAQFRADESGNYQNWSFGQSGFRHGQEDGPRGPHPDYNYNRAQASMEDDPAWEPDPPPVDADYADDDAVDVKFGSNRPGDFRGRAREWLGGTGARLKKGFEGHGGAFAVGYSAMALGSGISTMERLNEGQYVSPEEAASAEVGAYAPAAGGLIGTAIGAAAGGAAGGMAGQFLGQAAAQAGSAVFTAGEDRAQATREAAERLSASLGGAADVVDRFKGIIDATGAPVAQLGQGLATLQGFAPGVGADAIAGAGRSALAQGEYFQRDTETTGRFLSSNPALAPLTSDYARHGSELTRGSFEGIAELALSEGNMDAFNAARMQAQKATRNNDTEYQKDARDFAGQPSDLKTAGADGNWLNTADLWMHDNFPAWAGGGVNDSVSRARDARLKLEARGKALDGDVKSETDRYTNEYLDVSRGRQGLVEAGLGEKIAETGFSLAEATGSSAADLRGRLPGLRAAYGAASAADQTLIDTATGQMNRLNPKDFQDPRDYVALREGFQTDINRARADQVDSPLHVAQSERAVLGGEIEESGAAFGLRSAGARAGLTRGLLAGRTYAQLQGEEDALLGGERARAGEIRREAANPLLRPAERFKMQAEATGLETEAETQQYGYKLAGYTQALGGLDARTAEAGRDVTQAKLFGTPDAVYGAQTGEVEALSAKLRELTAEITRGGLAVDDLNAKTRERASAESQLAQATAQRRDDRLASGDALAGDQFRSDTAGLSRAVRVGGSGAADVDRVNADFGGIFAADRARVNAFAPGTVQRRDAEAKLTEDEARSREYEDGLNQFMPVARTATADLRAEGRLDSARHEFRRAQEAPFLEGPDSSPLTKGLGLEREIGAGLTRVGTEQGAETAFRASRQGRLDATGKPLWDDLAEEHYAGDMDRFRARREGLLDERQQLEHDRLYEGVLPQEIEKRIGSPGGGIGVAITPLSAAAQGSGPYNPALGGFGAHPNPLMTMVGGTSHEGGAMGMWWATRGGNNPARVAAQEDRAGAGGEQTSTTHATGPIEMLLPGVNDPRLQGMHIGHGSDPEVVATLKVIAGLMHQVVQNGRGGGQAPPMSPQAAVHNFYQDNARF